MTDFSFLEPAEIEFEEAVNYYNAQRRDWAMISPRKLPPPSPEYLDSPKPGVNFRDEPADAEPTGSLTRWFIR